MSERVPEEPGARQAQPAESRRSQRARLANMRAELLAPVNAIVGYAELLYDEASRDGSEDVLPDLGRILEAARGLYGTVDRLLESEVVPGEGGDFAEVQKVLRHDLRVPLNGIKGYAEMLLEDLDKLRGEPLRADFLKLLEAADRLLGKLDTIVDFSRVASDASSDESDPSAAMFADLVQSIRPIDRTEALSGLRGRILIADDNEMNRDLLSRRLSSEGHQVMTASGGGEALEMAAKEAFDVILLDLMMPDMNGFEVLARLKQDHALHEVPVIMISALHETDTVVRCIEAGAEDYLSKPFDPVLLRARINTCLEKKHLRERERIHLDSLEIEKSKVEGLLLNILPRRIVDRLNEGETVIADRFDDATVLFADLVGFSDISARLPPTDLVTYLNSLYSRFDALAQELVVEKVKMIGDSYMVVAGLPEPRLDHAPAVAEMALGMIDALEDVNSSADVACRMRIGIHSGPVVAGIIGTHRFLYDVWGDTVNVASHLESGCPPNRIQVSETTREALASNFELAPRGSVEIKGKGQLHTFFLNGRK
jgi:class 3 adenylate cyclase/CheY-like chemotaxis protein